MTNNGDEVGKVTKQWSGPAKELFTDADNFGISFPMDLDVKCKLTLLAAVFLIVSLMKILEKTNHFFKDFMFFEDQGKQKKK